MIVYGKVTREVPVVLAGECDKCHKRYTYEDDTWEFQEMVHIKFTGGYGSIFGDTATFEADFCQECAEALFGEYLRCTDRGVLGDFEEEGEEETNGYDTNDFR